MEGLAWASFLVRASADVVPSPGIFIDTCRRQAGKKQFLGINGTYHGFAFIRELVRGGMNDAAQKGEFGRTKGMGLNIARTATPSWPGAT